MLKKTLVCNFIFLIFWIKNAQGAAPVFTPSSLTVEVTENLIIGGNVLTLTANDADGDRIAYSLATINPQHAVGVFNVAVTGEVTTRVALDYETEPKFTLVVRALARDEVAEQTIVILVLNVNEAPIFGGQLIGATASNYATGGYVVTTVEAVDPDRTTDILYTITDGNEEGDFAIHQTKGLVTVAVGQMLNRTITIAYALTIEAADEGQPPKTGTTTLIIGICNDGSKPETTLFRLVLIFMFIIVTAL